MPTVPGAGRRRGGGRASGMRSSGGTTARNRSNMHGARGSEGISRGRSCNEARLRLRLVMRNVPAELSLARLRERLGETCLALVDEGSLIYIPGYVTKNAFGPVTIHGLAIITLVNTAAVEAFINSVDVDAISSYSPSLNAKSKTAGSGVIIVAHAKPLTMGGDLGKEKRTVTLEFAHDQSNLDVTRSAAASKQPAAPGDASRPYESSPLWAAFCAEELSGASAAGQAAAVQQNPTQTAPSVSAPTAAAVAPQSEGSAPDGASAPASGDATRSSIVDAVRAFRRSGLDMSSFGHGHRAEDLPLPHLGAASLEPTDPRSLKKARVKGVPAEAALSRGDRPGSKASREDDAPAASSAAPRSGWGASLSERPATSAAAKGRTGPSSGKSAGGRGFRWPADASEDSVSPTVGTAGGQSEGWSAFAPAPAPSAPVPPSGWSGAVSSSASVASAPGMSGQTGNAKAPAGRSYGAAVRNPEEPAGGGGRTGWGTPLQRSGGSSSAGRNPSAAASRNIASVPSSRDKPDSGRPDQSEGWGQGYPASPPAEQFAFEGEAAAAAQSLSEAVVASLFDEFDLDGEDDEIPSESRNGNKSAGSAGLRRGGRGRGRGRRTGRSGSGAS